ncbi:olfactory receptor 13C7-like [Gastrophryne carolinensis]
MMMTLNAVTATRVTRKLQNLKLNYAQARQTLNERIARCLSQAVFGWAPPVPVIQICLVGVHTVDKGVLWMEVGAYTYVKQPLDQERSKMETVFNASRSFMFQGLVEMDKQRFVFLALFTVVYLCIMTLNSIRLFVVLKDQSLHNPMFILIANLFFNEIFGSSSFYPVVIADLITSPKTISPINCLIQSFCILTFGLSEMSIFAIMAFDRYLAICYPLRYATLVTNSRILKVVALSWVTCSTLVSIIVILAWNLPFCGNTINNLYCDFMSVVILSCVDTSLNRVYSAALNTSYVVISALVTIFSYFWLLMVCLRLSRESRQKALHTLVTHLLNFSIYLVGFLFTFLRYRLDKANLPNTVHLLMTVVVLVFPPVLNPLIFGIRTHTLKIKVIHYLQNSCKISSKSWKTWLVK